MFVQSEAFTLAHGGRLSDISVFGQESNPTTWKLAKMNLALRGIEANLGAENADTFTRDLHPDLKADYILANPPFNMSDWGQERLKDDVRWRYGVPPAGNANFAWVEHIVHHLAPNGIAGFVLSNGSMSSTQSGEGEIRRALVEADLVDSMIALPPQLFYGTGIPACLWFVARDRSGKSTRGGRPLRDRRGEVLFIDARQMGEMATRVHRELTDQEITSIAHTYHAWRGEETAGAYVDVLGLSRSAKVEEIADQGFVMTPGRYVRAADRGEDAEPFDDRLKTLCDQLNKQLEESKALALDIRARLDQLQPR
jgi:type I restriction enzyme M protein